MAKRQRPPARTEPTADPPFALQEWPADQRVKRKIAALLANPLNTRTHPPAQIAGLRVLFRTFGIAKVSILIDEADVLLAGHGWTTALREEGLEEVECCQAIGWPEDKKRAFMEADNRIFELGEWDDTRRLAELDALASTGWDLATLGWSTEALDEFRKSIATAASGPPADPRRLAERFGIVPFSVFNAREGWWQDRKRMWIALGIKSEVGRGENLLEFSDAARLDGDVYKERAAEHRKRAAAAKP